MTVGSQNQSSTPCLFIRKVLDHSEPGDYFNGNTCRSRKTVRCPFQITFCKSLVISVIKQKIVVPDPSLSQVNQTQRSSSRLRETSSRAARPTALSPTSCKSRTDITGTSCLTTRVTSSTLITASSCPAPQRILALKALRSS